MKYNNILETIGNTPHVRLNKLFPNHEVWIKLEKQNPGGSLKDRIALAMIEDAEKNGLLKPGGTIIEPSSGNTGVGVSFVGMMKGYKVIVTMPESMSVERRKLISIYGAEVVLTPRELGMKGAIAKAEELKESTNNSWIPQQFNNLSNPQIHAATTAQEVIADFPQGFDYLITGVGTGGHITGVGTELKKIFPNIKVIAVGDPIMNDTIAVSTASEKLTPELKTALQEAFMEIVQTEEGLATVAPYSHKGYVVGTDADYDSTRAANALFSK